MIRFFVWCSIFFFLSVTGCMAIPEKEQKKENVTVPIEKESRSEKEPYLLGGWSTVIVNQDPDRVENIRLAAETLNGTVLMPDESFSFNRAVGERTTQKGYREATIFVGDELGEAIGGGVCQLSSTLYMAVVQAGLSVTERHAHSQDVAYAKEGEDACVSFGSLDFCFVNNSESVITLKTACDGETVTAELWAKPSKN